MGNIHNQEGQIEEPKFLEEQKSRLMASELIGSNRVRNGNQARGCCASPWSLLVENSSSGGMVGATGVEPARIAPQDPKSCVSANSTTRPLLQTSNLQTKHQHCFSHCIPALYPVVFDREISTGDTAGQSEKRGTLAQGRQVALFSQGAKPSTIRQ